MKITPLVSYLTSFFLAIIWTSNLQMNNTNPLLISSLQEFSNHIKKAWFGQVFTFALSCWKIETIGNLNSWNESQFQLEVLGTHFICTSSHCENASEVLGHYFSTNPFSCSQSWCEPKARVTTLYTISITKLSNSSCIYLFCTRIIITKI